MKIITISGLDGSGKSTQIEMLKNYLESRGKKVFYFHSIQHGIVKKIIDFRNRYCLICRLTGKCKTRNNEERSTTHANWMQIQLRKIALMIDLCRFGRLIKELEKKGYDFLVSDRYFYDSVINIEYLENKPFNIKSIHKPDISVYLQVSPESIMSRERKPDQGMEYLKNKKERYDRRFSEWQMKLVDGNSPKEQIFETIKSFLQ